MRRFRLDRQEDKTGVSGTGIVADAVLFPDGVVVVRWRGEFPTTTIHQSLDSVKAIHLHNGDTKIKWLDKVCASCGEVEGHPDQEFCGYCGNKGRPVDETLHLELTLVEEAVNA